MDTTIHLLIIILIVLILVGGGWYGRNAGSRPRRKIAEVAVPGNRPLKPERPRRYLEPMGSPSNWPCNRLLLALPSSNLKRMMLELERFRVNTVTAQPFAVPSRTDYCGGGVGALAGLSELGFTHRGRKFSLEDRPPVC